MRATVASLLTLPAVGGVGIISKARIAQAAGLSQTPGAVFSDEELAKITVVTRHEVGFVVVDMAIGPEAFVPGAYVKLTSRYNNLTREGITDEEGKIVFDIKELSENPDYIPLDKLKEYEFNGTVEISCDGYRTFQTAKIRVHGAEVIVAPTRNMADGDTTPYPHLIAFNEWDILYTNNQFLTNEGNTAEQVLDLEGRNFPDGEVTITLREKDAPTSLKTTTAAPQNGVLKASMSHQFCLLGGESSLQVDKTYELVLTQGETTYLWPLQLSMVEGVGTQSFTKPHDFNPLNVLGSSKPNLAGLSFTWPESVPLLGGSTTNIATMFKSTGSVYFDPFGLLQFTLTFPLAGYKLDNSHPETNGWQKGPLKSAKEQFKKWKEKIDEIELAALDAMTRDGEAKKLLVKQASFSYGLTADLLLQCYGAFKWNSPNHIMQGSLGFQLALMIAFKVTEQFAIGYVPAFITFTVDVGMALAFQMGMHSEQLDPGTGLWEQVFDLNAWTRDSSTGFTFTISITPALAVGVGVDGILGIALKGKINLTVAIILPFDDMAEHMGLEEEGQELIAGPERPLPHLIAGWSADVSVVIQFFVYSKTFTWQKKPYEVFKDNWEDLYDDQPDPLSTQADVTQTLPEFMSGMKIVSSNMLQKSVEAEGMAVQSLETQAEGVSILKGMALWKLMRTTDTVKKLDDGGSITYAVYRFPGPKAKEQGGLAAQAEGTEDEALLSAAASRWHSSSVRYDAQLVRSVVGPQGGLATQAQDTLLPDPGVDDVRNTGGVRPTSDVIISTDDAGNPRLVYGNPGTKVIDIRTGLSTGGGARATCAFRIGNATVNGEPRSRLIMTVLDASEEFSYFVGAQRVIDFDITDVEGITHDDLFDYEFGLAFSSYSASAGGISADVDTVQIVLVSGTRSAGDDTPIASASTDLYFTYLRFYAEDLLSDDPSTAQYFQLTIPANSIMNPEGGGDGKFHCISSICCEIESADDGGSLLVAYLDRAADTPENVFSDNRSLVTVKPGFIFFDTDIYENTEVLVPNTESTDPLVRHYNNPTVMRLALSPKVAGSYTLTMQGRNSTAFFLLTFDAASNGFTTFVKCPIMDCGVSLNPWPQQDCFLTSLPSPDYQKTEEFINGTPETWDRSQYVLQKAWWNPTGAGNYTLHTEPIGPDNFNFSRFALNSAGSFIFWPEGKDGSDEHLYDQDGNDTVTREDEGVYQICACRVRQASDGSIHFSDPFIAADVPHALDSLEIVATHDRYAPFEVLSTQLIDTGDTMVDNLGNTVTLYHAAYLWYTSVPNLQCATVVASTCTLPLVSAGGKAEFKVTIRNDGNSFLSGCTIQMYVHDLELDGNAKPRRDSAGNYIEHGVTPVGEPFSLDFNATTLQASVFDEVDENGAFTNQEPDFALAPGKRSVYLVEVGIPADWTEVKYVSFHASDPRMAEGGGLAAQAVDDSSPVFQQFSVEPGTYPVLERRSSPEQSKSQRFMASVNLDDSGQEAQTYSDAPVTTYKTGTEPGASGNTGASSGTSSSTTRSATSLPRTGDLLAMGGMVGMGVAGAALAAYSQRRAENERRAEDNEADAGEAENE